MYGRIYLGADGEYQGDIQMAKRNVHINKTVQIFLRKVQEKYSIMGAYFMVRLQKELHANGVIST